MSMTNKEFFLKTLEGEMPVFIKVIKAAPVAKADFKPDVKARPAKSLMEQLATQWLMITSIVKTGTIDFSKAPEEAKPDLNALAELAQKNYEDLKKTVEAMTDKEWETGKALLTFPGGKWETKKYDMAWGFLHDAIHHRGQLSTYIRSMGGKVPSIYGGSADSKPTA